MSFDQLKIFSLTFNFSFFLSQKKWTPSLPFSFPRSKNIKILFWTPRTKIIKIFVLLLGFILKAFQKGVQKFQLKKNRSPCPLLAIVNYILKYLFTLLGFNNIASCLNGLGVQLIHSCYRPYEMYLWKLYQLNSTIIHGLRACTLKNKVCIAHKNVLHDTVLVSSSTFLCAMHTLFFRVWD